MTEKNKDTGKPEKKQDKAPAADDQQKNLNQVPFQVALESSFGAASFLASRTESHKFLFAQDFEWLLMPPIALKQFRIFRQKGNNVPIAFVSWANITDEVEERILAGNRKLAPKDWNEGKKTYLLDVITPFMSQKQILEQLAENEFKDKDLFVTKASKDGKSLETTTLKELLAEIKQIEEKEKQEADKKAN